MRKGGGRVDLSYKPKPSYPQGVTITWIQNKHLLQQSEQVVRYFTSTEVVAYSKDFGPQLAQVCRIEGQMTHNQSKKKHSH